MRSERETQAVAGMRVAVTGASGFIGARLVSLLRQQGSHEISEVRAYAHRPGGLAPNVLPLDDAGAVNRALAGCHALVHCAFDFHDMKANLRIIRVLGRACAAHGVRLVLLSTASVYEPYPDGTFDETARSEPVGVPYSDTKIRIEQEVISQSSTVGLHVVILQPTLVYGPRCRQWIDTPVRELLTGRVVLPDNGQGTCNAVYVDDVCAAAIVAINTSIPSGERFLVSGPSPVTWGQFYFALRDVLETGSISYTVGSETATHPVQRLHSPQSTMMVKRLAAKVIGPDTRAKLKFALQRLRSGGGEVVHIPQGAKLALYSSHGTASTAKAMQRLGWEPRINFQQGMALTRDYILSSFAAQIANSRRRDAERDKTTSESPQRSKTSARWVL